MAKSQLVSSVIQALILATCAAVIYEHLTNKAFTDVSKTEIWANFTKAADMLEEGRTSPAKNITSFGNRNTTLQLTNTTLQFTNTTLLNQTTTDSSDPYKTESFYWRVLPRTVFFNAILFSLQYLWYLWLEKTFPSRPRYLEISQGEKDFGSESREEAVVQRWVAQGRIRRASLNWVNTLIKWLLDMTLGQMWLDGLGYPLLDSLLRRKSISWILSDLKWGLLHRPWLPLLSLRPLASLLSFVVVPAHKRIVFMQGSELVWSTFLGVSAGILLPWASNTEFVKMIVANVTSEAEKHADQHVVFPVAAARADEL